VLTLALEMTEKFLAKARELMERRGTLGTFGKATPSKIKAGLKKGGAEAKKAGFAKAMHTIAERHKHGG
jgi:hypothetical protein